jgi:hypothetical protein
MPVGLVLLGGVLWRLKCMTQYESFLRLALGKMDYYSTQIFHQKNVPQNDKLDQLYCKTA